MLVDDYMVQLYSPLGVKKGFLELNKNGFDLSGRLDILNSSCRFDNGVSDNSRYEFNCTLNTIIGDINFSVHIYEKNDRLYGMVDTNKGCMAVTGKKVDDTTKSEVEVFNEQK